MTRQVPQQARAPISERPAGPLTAQCLAVHGGDAMRFLVGIDWASLAHAVCILDETGRIHWQGSVPHTAEGLAQLLGHLRRFRRRGLVRVALERPSGVLVDTLLEAGFEVVPVHPNALKASRPRYSAAGGKTDLGDAFILADLLRTDGHRLRPLRRAPTSQVGEAEAEASGEVVRALVAVLIPLVAHIQQLSAAIAAALPQHPDGPLVQSLPRSGAVNAAQILAELGDDRARFPTDEQFAAEAGLAPVTHASGQHRAVVFRWACNKRLRRAVTTFADNSRHASRWAALVYQRARARGCRHQHAIRILARAWARILWRCWQDRTPYHVGRHRAAQALAAA